MTAQTITMTTADIERMFLDWLWGQETPLKLYQIQRVLAESLVEIPDENCDEHGFSVGTTFGHAIRCSVAFLDQHDFEYRLGTRLHFDTEDESLRWWRNNRDNPDRVRVRHLGDGRYSLDVAPVERPERGGWKEGSRVLATVGVHQWPSSPSGVGDG